MDSEDLILAAIPGFMGGAALASGPLTVSLPFALTVGSVPAAGAVCYALFFAPRSS